MSGTEVVTLVGLSALAVEDIRTKQVSVVGVLFLGMALLFARFLGKEGFLPMTLGTIPGLLTLLLSIASKEQIGVGDGLVLIALGFGNGITKILGMLGFALLLSGVWALFLLLQKKKRNQTFPFLPFLLAGYGMVLLFG